MGFGRVVGRLKYLLNVHRQSVLTLLSVASALTIGLSLRLRSDAWTEREVSNLIIKRYYLI